MADATWTSGPRPDDGWGPATSVRGATPAPADASRGRSRATGSNGQQLPPALDPRGKSGGRSATKNRGNDRADDRADDRGFDRGAAFDQAFYPQASPAASARERIAALTPTRTERGLAGWLALLVLVVITFAGLLVDAARGVQLGGGFNVGIIAGSVIAILLVRRSGMFPVVVAPPIVYSLGAGLSLYIRSDGLAKRNVLIDAAANWLVYGFPAIAGATAAVLIIAGVRLIARR